MKDDRDPSQSTSEGEPAFAELARRQGVRPIDDFQKLVGHPSAQDETADEFAVMLREWRHEGTASTRHQ